MSVREQLKEYITQDLVILLMKDRNIKVNEAMNTIYNSTVFKKLLNDDSGLYLESSLYVFDLLQNELRNGVLIQEEQ